MKGKLMRIGIMMTAVALASGLALYKLPQSKASGGKTFDLEDATLNVEIPDGWESVEGGLFGSPLSFVGPWDEEHQTRPTVLVATSGQEGAMPRDGFPQEFQDGYRAEREKYIEDINGELKSLTGFKEEQWPNAERVQCSTMDYMPEIDSEEEIVEKTCFVLCKGQGYVLQSMMRTYETEKSAVNTDKILKSFSCQ